MTKLIAEFELTSGKTIKRVMSDNVGEILNKQNELLFMKEKIIHETSSPFTPQQNGQIERELQTIQDMARAILIQSKSTPTVLILKEALHTACYPKLN